MEEAESHLWEAVDVKLAKQDIGDSLTINVRFLPCLELLKDILEQQGGSERLAKAEGLRKEMEESKAGVEVMYAAALEEIRREKREKRKQKVGKKKKGSKKRRGRKG